MQKVYKWVDPYNNTWYRGNKKHFVRDQPSRSRDLQFNETHQLCSDTVLHAFDSKLKAIVHHDISSTAYTKLWECDGERVVGDSTKIGCKVIIPRKLVLTVPNGYSRKLDDRYTLDLVTALAGLPAERLNILDMGNFYYRLRNRLTARSQRVPGSYVPNMTNLILEGPIGLLELVTTIIKPEIANKRFDEFVQRRPLKFIKE